MQTFIAAEAGNYLFIVAGGQGGGVPDGQGTVPGLGATVEATVFLQTGATVPINVAGQGSQALPGPPVDNSLGGGGGGGGLSAVYTDNTLNALPTIVAGPTTSMKPRVQCL